MDDEPRKRRRIIIDDEDDEEIRSDVGSNPDDLLSSNPSDEEEGEDLMEHWKDDYAPAPELDYYDSEDMGDDDADAHETFEQRRRYIMSAEEEMAERDAKLLARQSEYDADLEQRGEFGIQDFEDEDLEGEYEDSGADKHLNLEKFDCPLREWINNDRTRREIHRRFKLFLKTYYDGFDEVANFFRLNPDMDPKTENLPAELQKKVKPPIYQDGIRKMCADNLSSLVVSYKDIAKVQSLLAIWLTDVPRDMLQIFDEVLKEVVLERFPHYSKISKTLHVRITSLPLEDRLRDLRQSDLNNLVRVCGVVTRRTGVMPRLLNVTYECSACAHTIGPIQLNGNDFKPEKCPQCNTRGGMKVNQQKTTHGDFQKLILQETPGTVPAGRIPRTKDIYVYDDLVDVVRPGDEVEVIGIYAQNASNLSKKNNGFPVFNTVIEANNIQKISGGSNAQWTETDRRLFESLAKDSDIGTRIIDSIAPSIYDLRHVKTAIALSLFGGRYKDGKQTGTGTYRIRGDINVLLLGDPGTAKSQILKYAEKTAPRAVYTTGKGASAVGLTAGVHRDPTTKEWTLEGGALVLADKGVCLIDEFDKMNDQDRTSIHEAMEQQTISVSKAGIVTSLQARCAVIAAANPIGGRYDNSYSFSENVELTDPILSRFDILCVLEDKVDPLVDEKLAMFVTNSHIKSHPSYEEKNEEMEVEAPEATTTNENGAAKPPIPQDVLRKYIAYARSEVNPILHDVQVNKIADLYTKLRAQSEKTGGIPIAVRHVESIVRMAEASARMHLRDHVREDDVDFAIKIALTSFLQAQKISVQKALKNSLQEYVTYREDSNLLLMHELQKMFADEEKYKQLTNDKSLDTTIPIKRLEDRAKQFKIFNLQAFFTSKIFRSHGLIVDWRLNTIVKARGERMM